MQRTCARGPCRHAPADAPCAPGRARAIPRGGIAGMPRTPPRDRRIARPCTDDPAATRIPRSVLARASHLAAARKYT